MPGSDRHLSLNTKAVSQETVLLLTPDSRIKRLFFKNS